MENRGSDTANHWYGFSKLWVWDVDTNGIIGIILMSLSRHKCGAFREFRGLAGLSGREGERGGGGEKEEFSFYIELSLEVRGGDVIYQGNSERRCGRFQERSVPGSWASSDWTSDRETRAEG